MLTKKSKILLKADILLSAWFVIMWLMLFIMTNLPIDLDVTVRKILGVVSRFFYIGFLDGEAITLAFVYPAWIISLAAIVIGFFIRSELSKTEKILYFLFPIISLVCIPLSFLNAPIGIYFALISNPYVFIWSAVCISILIRSGRTAQKA